MVKKLLYSILGFFMLSTLAFAQVELDANADNYIDGAYIVSGAPADNSVLRWSEDGATDKVQPSLVTINDAGSVNIPAGQTYNIDGTAHTHAGVYQAVDAELTALAGLTYADASIVQLTGASAAAVLTSGGNNRFLKSTSDNSALEFAVPTLASFTGQTAWRIFYSNGDGDVTELALGAAGTALVGQGATSAPAFSATPSFQALTLTGENTLSVGTSSSLTGSILFKNATNNNAFTIASGASGAAIGWILPTAAPGGANYLLNVDADGTMGYTDPSSLGGGYTNLTSFVAQTAWRIFYSNADGDVTELALGSDGEYLKSNGASSAPSWATPSGAAHDAVTIDADAAVLLDLSTQEIGLDVQTANYVFAGPETGVANEPTFRALVDADIPAAIARDTEIPDVSAYDTAEERQDEVGAMFSSNTETGVTATYQDDDGTIDLVVSISTSEVAAATLVTAAETIAANNNDTTLPTSAAVKAYADSVAGAPTNVTPVDTADENATFYPLLVDGATGSQATETDGELTYNPSSGLLTVPTLSSGAGGFTVDADGDVVVKSLTATATASPGLTALDSDSPGADKTAGFLGWQYVDGADGSENSDWLLQIMQGGSLTTILSFDESDDQFETAKAFSSSAAITTTAAVTAGTSFIIGDADINQTDLEKLDGITNGTQAANKAVVADANINTGIAKVTALHIGTSGSETQVTASAAELNYLDITTLGTGVANKAVVLDGSGNYTAPAGAWNLGGATSFEIPNGTNPNVDAAGEITFDTDGANITGDASVRGYDGSAQVLLARKLHDIHVTVVAPNSLADAVRDAFLVWSNETGMVFTITQIKAWSGTDNTELNVELTDADGANNATIEGLNIQTDGTGVYTTTDTAISGDATVAAGQLIWLDFDDTDEPTWVKVTITGWFNADVD